jgi:hypothetical protein
VPRKTPFALALALAAAALTGTAAAPGSAATPGSAPAPGSATAPAANAPRPLTVRHSCATPAAPGYAACDALHVTGGTLANGDSVGQGGVQAPTAAPLGYGPADLRDAYRLPATGGNGRTVAVVDAYDDPDAEADLSVYRAQYGLPACTTANGCLRKVGQTGSATTLPRADSGWAEEISLDLDMVSAFCPDCHILLVEADSAADEDLGQAVNEAVALGAAYVSNSYGGPEESADPTYDTRYFDHPGVAVTASSGDDGYGPQYPAASRFVTAVGGTSLKRDSGAARGWTETAWSGAGSGCSRYDAKPAWQKDTGCANRSIADVAAVADPGTGVAVYDTYDGDRGWSVFGGTSAAAPAIAAVYALAGTPSTGSTPASFPYAHAPAGLFDVTAGSNGSCGGSYLCAAGPGYDGPTGLGTPDGTGAFGG